MNTYCNCKKQKRTPSSSVIKETGLTAAFPVYKERRNLVPFPLYRLSLARAAWQAGTRDPVLEHLHLDMHLLLPASDRIQRSYKDLKITVRMHRWGKLQQAAHTKARTEPPLPRRQKQKQGTEPDPSAQHHQGGRQPT